MIQPLVERAWNAYEALDGESYAVHPACPILYFGDASAYLRSARKVITVGLNPSRLEFPEGDRFRRFPGADEVLAHGLTQHTATRYVQALDNYFTTAPYSRWFASFEPVLNGMGCSYYPGAHAGTALHTDIGSPLATDPTWTGLSADAKDDLEREGAALWHDLVRALQPDVILLSIRRALVGRIRFPRAAEWTVVHRIDGTHRKRPYEVEAARYEIVEGHEALAVFGRAAQMPFGLITKQDKEALGRRVESLVDG